MGKKNFVNTEDLNLELVDPGTIRIDCSGAFIGNDHLVRDDTQQTKQQGDKQQIQPALVLLLLAPTRLRLADEGVSTDHSSSSASSSSEDSDSEAVASRLPSIVSINQQPNASTSSTEAEDVVAPVATGDDFNITKNITLPKHNSEMIHMSIDIGGTLTKLVYFTTSSSSLGGKLHFKDFQTENFENQVLKYIIKLINKSLAQNNHLPPITYIMATGGGAHKFYKLMTKTFAKNKLPMKIIAKDEMECLIRGSTG